MVSTIFIVGSIQATLLGYVLISRLNIQWIPLCLTAYIKSQDLIKKIIKQTYKTKHAVVESLSENSIFFYDDEISKLPSLYPSQIIEPTWIYKGGCFLQPLSSENKKIRLPYLSSELTNGQTTYSLSEWMETVRICSDTLPSLRIIVSSWAIDTKHPVDLFNKDNPWKFNVITEDGDELYYDVLSGDKGVEMDVDVDADAEAEEEAEAEAEAETT
jgi:hypothetical protein